VCGGAEERGGGAPKKEKHASWCVSFGSVCWLWLALKLWWLETTFRLWWLESECRRGLCLWWLLDLFLPLALRGLWWLALGLSNWLLWFHVCAGDIISCHSPDNLSSLGMGVQDGPAICKLNRQR